MTNAERQRRYRERKREQQKAAQAAAPAAVTSPVTADDVTPATPDVPVLGPRGARLWREVTAEGGELRPAERVLLEEACRLTDRLDRLDAILAGTADDWLRFHTANEDGTVVKVIVTGPLVEVRQQQVALKALLAELRTSRGAASGRAGTGRAGAGRQPSTQQSTGTSQGGGGGVVSIAAHVAGKLRGTAG